jgi:hypothetical protein
MRCRRLPKAVAFAVVGATLAAPLAASAWTEQGHRIVAAIAEARLSPAARRLVREIVGEKPLSDPDIAGWADDQRDAKKKGWHYVNVPASAEHYEPGRDCPRDGCAVSAFDAAAFGLRDAHDAAGLADSLRWLVHLAADLHQPMHAGELRDRGGNATEVRLGKRRQPVSVHRLWDAEVLDPLLKGSDPLRVARELAAAIRPTDAAAWVADLSPAAMASESHLLTRAIYRELGTFPVAGGRFILPASYPEAQRARVVEALSKAGFRLAALLDRIAVAREAQPPPTSPLPH